MVMLTSSEPPGSHSCQSYYATRRTPFVALNSDVTRYNSEVLPLYSDHDARIRGASLHSSTDTALVQRSSSCTREAQSSSDKALVQRSSSCSREVQTSGAGYHQRGVDVKEYIKHGAQGGKEYVIEEHIPPEYNYHIPSKKTQMELMTLSDSEARAHSVPPSSEAQPQWVKVPAEPGLLYYVPFSSGEEHHLAPKPEQPTYYGNRRAVFSEPRGSELKQYDFKITPSEQLRSSSVHRRSRSHSREHALNQQVIYEDDSSNTMHNIMSTSRKDNFEKALVPFDRSQSMPPAEKEYSYQWIKIPTGPQTITVYPRISSSDPRTWTQDEPQQITNYDTHKAVDSHHSYDNDIISRSSSRNKENYIVTYEHFPKQDMSLDKKEIAIDQRFDRSHKDNRGSEYRSKFVRYPRGPSAFIYSSIHSRDQDACTDPSLSGYVGSGNFHESKDKKENEYTQTSASSISKNYMVNKSTSKVNRILNTSEDLEKKHFLDMLFNIQHIIKEREALGEYEIPPRMKNKMNFLTKSIHDVSRQNKCRKDLGTHEMDSVKSLVSYSHLLAPIRPDRGRTSATTRFNYMFHGLRVL